MAGTRPSSSIQLFTGSKENDPLQLEHMIGYAGDYKNTLHAIPQSENLFIKSMGSLVSIENLLDPHDQKLLRGHDMQVSAVAVSPSGRYVASGQIGTKNYRGNTAPIFLWSIENATDILVLKGLTLKVNLIAFSTDEKMICACGEDCLLYIWETLSGDLLFGQRFAAPATVLKWIEHRKMGHYVSYELVIGVGSTMNKGIFSYEQNKVQWKLQLLQYACPVGGGLLRYYTCADVAADGIFVYAGTTGGDMVVFRRPEDYSQSTVLRAVIPICSNMLESIVSLDDGDVLCGGGDGTVQRVTGRDLSWRVILKTALDGGVNCLSLSANGSELLVACRTGSVFRLLVHDFSKTLVDVGHTSAVLCIASVVGNRSTTFVAGTKTGELRLWDIVDYSCRAVTQVARAGSVLCLACTEGMVLSGWEDGFIRCHDTASLRQLLWHIPNSHRSGVQSIAVYAPATDESSSLRYFVSGGADGIVRIWKLDSRELVTQYSEHPKAVARVLVDIASSKIVHSLSIDGTILSFDLKRNRRIISHLSPTGNMLDMTQRLDSERELITTDNAGRIQHWDIDYRDAVYSAQDPARAALRCCSVSPSGRFLAFAGDDAIIRVLELSSSRVLSLGQAHSNVIRTFVWTQDEKQLVSGGDDFSICVWNFFLA